MKYYKIYPEVAGAWGENTIGYFEVRPPIIFHLHYLFSDWLGDDILETFPVYIVSEKLANVLKISNLSGFELAFCEISKAEIFYDLNPNGKDLPQFFWLKIHGTPPDDFFLLDGKRLCISQKALEILQTCNLHYADIEEITI